LFFVSQWEKSFGDKNARNKMKKENPPNKHFTMWQEKYTFWDTPTL
jgi:hypothetical protein